jgi:signal transduction histidine kinase
MKEKRRDLSRRRVKKPYIRSDALSGSSPPVAFSSGAAPPLPLDLVLASLPDGVVVCDRNGKLSYCNDAALKLFEISDPGSWLQMPLQEFLARYGVSDEEQSSLLLLNQAPGGETSAFVREETLTLRLPSGRSILLDLRYSSLFDPQRQVNGTLSLFRELPPRFQKALHLQRVSEAIFLFHQALAQIPDHASYLFSPGQLLFSSPALVVSQQLVEVIRQVLACWRVSLLASGGQDSGLSYVVGSGFTAEQEQQRLETRGRFISADIVDETILNILQSNREVILRADRLHFPPDGLHDFGAANLLCVPLFLEHRYAGILVIAKQGWDSQFSQDEIELVKTVAAQAVLIIECLGELQKQTGEHIRERVLQEVKHLSSEFLTLASHELRTPLTAIKGNLQLAQRRLSNLKRHLVKQDEQVSGYLEHTQWSLAQAAQSAQMQERFIQEMVDNIRIQTDQLDLSMQPCDLLALVKAAVEKQRAASAQWTITLENLTGRSTLSVMADAGRIQQVLTMYLTNAVDSSPARRPITVYITSENKLARVSVHNEGPGLSLEVQEHLRGRFSPEGRNGIPPTLDLHLGLRFSLCQALIERHQGQVGIESKPDRGATFWFRLPVEG